MNVVWNERPTTIQRASAEVVTVDLPDGYGIRFEVAEEEEANRIVNEGRRVVCTIGNFESLSSGYIDCLPDAR